MKVLIVGSMRLPDKPGPEDEKEVSANKLPFKSACIAIGAALARRNHTIMVGVPAWEMLHKGETVAKYVPLGAEKAGKVNGQKPHVIFYGPQVPEPPDDTKSDLDTLQNFKNELHNIELEDKIIGHGQGTTKWYPDIAEVDAVVLIGGREGTSGIGYAAYSIRKPCIAITSLGGAAEELSTEILQDDYMRFVDQGDITAGDVRAWAANWSANEDDKADNANADKIVSGIERLVKAISQASKESLRPLLFTLGSMGALLVLWLLLYLRVGNGVLPDKYAFFLLLYTSALLGAGLRILTSYQDNTITQVTPLGLGIDATIALLVAFGLAIIYLIGGISFTGKVVVLESTGGSDTFATISLGMSLLGLAAGYLVPLNELRQRLQKMISEEKK